MVMALRLSGYAIVVKPGKDMLPELNTEYANWIQEDALEVGKRAAHAPDEQSIQRRKPTVITARDNLLTVIQKLIAVGLPVTRQPPHRSRRAVFPHRALREYSLPQQD